MKLKKIASLALAGIMAVSMLAGCKDGGNGNSGSSSSENTGTATGYSAMLGEKAAETLSDNDLDEIFTFADDADDQKALEKIIFNDVSESLVTNLVPRVNVDVVSNYPAGVGIVNGDFQAEVGTRNWGISLMQTGTDSQNTQTYATVWVANGTVSMDTVMSEVFEDMKTSFENAKKDGTTANAIDVNYTYDVSVSVVNKAATSSTQFNGSLNFIGVVVTRTAEVA